MADKKRWYVICVANTEAETKKALQKESRIQGLEKKFGQFFIPRTLEWKYVNGHNVQHRVKAFPGYLLARLEWTPEVHTLVMSNRTVAGVLPMGWVVTKDEEGEPIPWKPTACDTKEIAIALLQHKASAHKEKPENKVEHKPPFAIGDEVEILEGILAGQIVKVTEVTDKNVTIAFEIMGMKKPFTFPFNHLRKV